MRRICCFCESWESGGIEAFIHNVLLHMDLSQTEVDIVAERMKESVFTSDLKNKGIRFIELSGRLRNPKNFRLFRDLLKERRYDVVHFNLFQGLSLYYAQIAKKESIPVRIAHSHGSGLRNSRTKRIKLFLHGIGRWMWTSAATDHWACSRQAGEFLFRKDQYRLEIIPNGIDVQRFQFSEEARKKVRTELGIDEGVLLGTVGRLSSEKNQSFLLDVFSVFLRINPSSLLVLVGEGEEKSALMQKCEELGIADKVVFYGLTNAVEELLSAMDLFVFPSLVEGLGIACVEAQASGLPVLCSTAVPVEAKITPTVRALDLDEEAQCWAQTLAEIPLAQSRSVGSEMVRSAGYDISDVALLVSKKYRE